MIIFGTYSTLVDLLNNDYMDTNRLVVFNLTGYKEGFVPLRILPTDNSIYYLEGDDRVSDIALLNYIYTNDAIFFEFFSKIIYPFYSGLDIYIIVYDNGMFDEITDSVYKIIQQRYGYNPIILNNYTDLDYADQDSSMNINGIYNFDIDKQRYISLGVSQMGVPKARECDDPNEVSDNLLLY